MPHAASSELLDRLPPQNLDAEKGVLGSVLLDPALCARVASVIDVGDFYAEAHVKLFRHLLAMHDEGRRIDATLLVDRLKQSGDFEAVGGAAYLADVMHSVAVASHAVQYAEIVRDKARLRSMIHAATEILQACYAAHERPEEIANRAEAILAEVAHGEYSGEPRTSAECCREAVEFIDQIITTGQSGGVMIGLEKFDEDYGGLHPGELTILAARVRIGKTALGRQIARHVGGRGRLVYFASTEMPARDLTLRDLTSLSDVSLKRIRTGKIGGDDRKRLVEAANRLSGANVVTQYRPSMTMREIHRTARRLKKHGLALVVVDYLQRVRPAEEDRRAQRYTQVGNVAGACKTMAGELMVPVLALCQVGREVERGTGKKDGNIQRPTLADLRESGDIEAHADNVLFLHRQVAGYRLGVDEKTTDLLVAKYRNGPTGAYKLEWDGERMELRDVESGGF
jgi:replicative DNA helicase